MKEQALYLEADEDITSAIDKLQKAPGHAVQIVVPKRSTLLQSIINLKLLKKAASDSGKELVLVTNDRIATDLAARVGLAVATSLGAKAVRAEMAAPQPTTHEDIIEASDPEPSQAQPEPPPKPAKASPKRPLFARREVGEAATSAAIAGEAAASTADNDPAPAAKPHTPKIPNFQRLQQRLFWVGGAIVVVIAYLVAMFAFASAKVTLYASGTKVDISLDFAADPNLKQTDTAKGVLAAQSVTFSKDLSVPFTATGKKDAGTKASGQMTVYNEFDTSPHTLVAGTRFQAPDGKIFRSRADVTVPGATVGLVGGQFVLTPGKSDPVAVDADQNGDGYNQAPAKYTIPAYSGEMQAKIYGRGGQMSGGTTKNITVVTQADVDKAKTDALAKDKDASQRDLEGRVPSGYVALAGSGSQAADNIASNPAVDQEATTATLTFKAVYTQLAVLKTDYETLVRVQEQKQIGDQNQIYDNGLANAQVTATGRDAGGRQSFHFTTQAYGGAKLDQKQIVAQIKGKRYGDAVNIATKFPGVQRAEISLWPVWSTNLPGRDNKITVNIQVAGAKGK